MQKLINNSARIIVYFHGRAPIIASFGIFAGCLIVAFVVSDYAITILRSLQLNNAFIWGIVIFSTCWIIPIFWISIFLLMDEMRYFTKVTLLGGNDSSSPSEGMKIRKTIQLLTELANKNS